MFPILFYNELDYKNVEKKFDKVLAQLTKGDFKSADVRKMSNTAAYYRAKLNDKDRLLFTFVSYKQKKYLLLLEVIPNHDYAKSRFLRTAQLPDEEVMQLLAHADEVQAAEIKNLSYVNATRNTIHVLNKYVSFDDTQQLIFTIHPPLIIIGSAGSGKTLLVLEKIKQLQGNVAYISLSNYLVENARKIYFSNGYGNEHNEVDFLSFQQYLETWQIPAGKEINFRVFEQWFSKHAQQVKINEPYRFYEEFKGVLTGSPLHAAFLSKQEYLLLGVKQSIFTLDKRPQVYDLFTRYLQWMKDNNYYDSNIISYQYLSLVKPRYDYIVIDEVQDITAIQLKCLVQSLTSKGNFILTGDSNQIVHPNFFSWSKIKTYFYEQGTGNKEVSILQSNYRNSPQVVQLSNTLLKIKNARFGSIDKESNYLINTISNQAGEVLLLQDDDKVKAELNRKTQDSTHYAVLVVDTRLKEEARKYFKTPLIFSVQEAKGLEYENVILLNFISTNPAEFSEIIQGVKETDLHGEGLHYARPADKTDKDAEIYKFYINSFYVAITRSVKNIYLFEKQVNHPALELLALKEMTKPLQVAEQKSGRQEWLEEARRLEEQGKHEQAEQIRAKYLGYEYISAEQLEQIKKLALDPDKKEHEVKKERKQLFQYASTHRRVNWINQLAKLQFQRAIQYIKELRSEGKEYAKNCRLGRKEEVSRVVQKFGPDFTVPDVGLTGLMVALYHGQDVVADLLLQQEANINSHDINGMLPVDHLLQGYYKNVIYRHTFTAGKKTLVKYWPLVKPASFKVQESRRIVNLGGHSMVFFLFICLRCTEQDMKNKVRIKFSGTERPEIVTGEFSMDDIMKLVECMPEEILPQYRRQRNYVNSVLAGNEVEKDSPSNKKIFKRVSRGCYILNPDLMYKKEIE